VEEETGVDTFERMKVVLAGDERRGAESQALLRRGMISPEATVKRRVESPYGALGVPCGGVARVYPLSAISCTGPPLRARSPTRLRAAGNSECPRRRRARGGPRLHEQRARSSETGVVPGLHKQVVM